MFSTWKSGPQMSAVQAPQSTGLSAGPGGWHPTVLYMLGLIVLEILIVGFLSRQLMRLGG
jgi:hypothetical protein